MLNSDYDTVLAAGQGKLAGKIVRIGHMGLVERGHRRRDRGAGRRAGAPRLQEAGGGRPA